MPPACVALFSTNWSCLGSRETGFDFARFADSRLRFLVIDMLRPTVDNCHLQSTIFGVHCRPLTTVNIDVSNKIEMSQRTSPATEKSANGDNGRQACTKSISMMPKDWEWIRNRVAALSPRVKGISHYFQMLADMDKREGLLERVIGAPPEAEESLKRSPAKSRRM